MRNQKQTYSPFKVKLQTRRLTNGSVRRETRRAVAPAASTAIVLAQAA